MKTRSFARFPRFVLSMFLFYVLFVGGLYLFQRSFIYHPDHTPFDPARWALAELKPVDVTTQDGVVLHHWYKPPVSDSKLTIVFFQGNAGSLGRRNYKIRSWMDAGYGIYLVGYRGFGNEGAPTEVGLYDDARSALDYLIAIGVPEEALVLYGESLGTGVAAQMATEHKVGGLVLEAPYTSLPNLARTYYPMVPINLIMQDRFKTIAKMWRIHTPVFIMHGEADRLVPVDMGHAVFDAANTPKQAVFVPNAGHNTIYNDETEKALFGFLNRLPTVSIKEKAIQSDVSGS